MDSPPTIPPLQPPTLLAPFLPALPAAAASHEPAIGILPLLSPILRQRVLLLAPASTEPWLRLLCYDASKTAKLGDIARSEGLEPHPVSGEVEIDWDYDAETRYRRADEETLQALVVLTELGLAFHAIWCVGDVEGGGDGWRVGEVTVADKAAPFRVFGGVKTVEGAERVFRDAAQGKARTPSLSVPARNGSASNDDAGDEDDGYWDRYDATPARTPAQGRSPAPPQQQPATSTEQQPGTFRTASADDHYFAQYDDVQPAMDNHDPDEEAAAAAVQVGMTMPPLGLSQHQDTTKTNSHLQPSATTTTSAATNGIFTNGTSGAAHSNNSGLTIADVQRANHDMGIIHPRPESSGHSSSGGGSNTVARLEETAGKQEASEFGVKQHVSRSIRSLYLLSRASGIDREEFERLVKTELDVLGMIEDI